VTIEYRTPNAADGLALSAMARASFAATFADKIEPAELAVYLDTAYGPAGDMQRDLANPAVKWRAAYDGDAPIGYIKVSALALPYEVPFDPASGAMEVRQLYIHDSAKGSGVADTLMRWAIDLARSRSTKELYLAVFDDNARAVRFYTRHGFGKVGSFTFYTGSQPHDDGIWRLVL
jgi:ribosomal protein S18 acetylase RimI-like enzyme